MSVLRGLGRSITSQGKSSRGNISPRSLSRSECRPLAEKTPGCHARPEWIRINWQCRTLATFYTSPIKADESLLQGASKIHSFWLMAYFLLPGGRWANMMYLCVVWSAKPWRRPGISPLRNITRSGTPSLGNLRHRAEIRNCSQPTVLFFAPFHFRYRLDEVRHSRSDSRQELRCRAAHLYSLTVLW